MAWVNTSPLVKTYSLDEFWELPEPPDHSKVELIAGVLYLTPSPEWDHDRIVSRLNRLLSIFLAGTKDDGTLYAPRAGIWTSQNTWLEPDLFYVSAELESRLDPKQRTTADLVIEVISPGSAIFDRNTKADTYWALKVRELWLVDEKSASIEVRAWTDTGYVVNGVYYSRDTLTSTVLTSLKLPVGEVFS